MNIQKNQEYIVDIVDNGYEGEGIAKIDNFTIFIPGAIKGEKVKIIIVKVLTSHAFGKILEIINKSETRQEVDCSTYKRCSSCSCATYYSCANKACGTVYKTCRTSACGVESYKSCWHY